MPGNELIDSEAIFAPLNTFRRIGLAVSGGSDSLALMLLAADYARRNNAHDRFVVYSVDHGLRPEAADEVGFVLAMAAQYGLVARGLRWEGEKPSTGIQQAARAARYRLIGVAMAQDGVEILVTAHHLGDQAETVLMRLAHGSGVEGLRGMDYFAEVDSVMLVRPLLGIERAQLARVVAAAGLASAADPSNIDATYERVRWRQMMPPLAAMGLDARRLARFAERMRDADEALEEMAATIAVDHDEMTGGRRISREALRRAPRAVAIRALGNVLRIVGAGAKAHDLAPVEALVDRLRSDPALKRTSLHACLICSDGEPVVVAPEPGRVAKPRPDGKALRTVTRN